MMTRSLRTIMISAYLSAMLTSSVLHVRGNVILAGAIDPTAAQRALQSAVSGLSVEGWSASMTIPSAVAMPTAAMSTIPTPPAADPAISEELMARLIKRTLASDKDGGMIGARLCLIFAMCDGTSDMPAKQISVTKPDGKHYVEIPRKEGSNDVIVTFQRDDVIECYLTDKSGKLRAAAISGKDGAGLRLISNEEAAERFRAEMQFLAKLAEKLPPTGTAVAAGNS